MLTEFWKSRELLLYLSILEFKLRYKGTFLGLLWSVFEPLAQLAILFAVFSFLRPSDESFLVHLFTGLIMIHLFSRSTTHAMNILIVKRPIVNSVNISRLVFPLSSIMAQSFTFAIEIVILFGFIIGFGLPLTVHMLFFALTVILLMSLVVGTSLLISVIRLYFKDIQTIWSIVTMSLIFITPVFWYVDEMPKEISETFLLNPLATLIHIGHQSLLFSQIPSSSEIAYGAATSIGIFFCGYFLFKKKEQRLVELL